MTEKPPLDENSPAVQKHLDIMQGVITRMADGSRMLKTWCITIVAAILVVAVRSNAPGYVVLVALVPTVMFFVLDAYYLGMEKGFRDQYDAFVRDLHSGQLASGELYAVKKAGGKLCLWCNAAKSFSVWGFYAVPVIVVALISCYLPCDSP